MGQTNAKYIALVLAHLLERATKYAKAAEEPTRSARDRAIRTALAVDAATAYNYALRTMGHIVADERKIEFSKFLSDRLIHSHRKQRDSVKMLDDAGISAILEEAYGYSEATLQADTQEKNLELATALVIAQGQSPAVRHAIATLAKYKQLHRIKDLLKDSAIADIIKNNVAEPSEAREARRELPLKEPEPIAFVDDKPTAWLTEEGKVIRKEEKDILDLLEK